MILRRAIALSAIVAVVLSTASVALAACQMQCGSTSIPVAAHSIVSGDAHAHMHHAAMHHHASHATMTPDGADLLVSSGCLVHSACPVAKAKIQDAALNPVERRVQPAGLLFTKLTVVGGTALVEPGPPSALTHSSRPLVITPLRI